MRPDPLIPSSAGEHSPGAFIDAPSSQPTPNIGWPGALLLVLAGVVSAYHVGKPSAVLEVLQADLGVDIGTASWLVSASGIVGAVAGAAIGMLSDRLGARRMVLLGLFVQACASAAGAMAAGPGWLLASRVAEGLGFQLVVVGAPALIAAAMRVQSRTAAMAAWSTFMPVGLAGALLSVAWLAPSSWKPLWWFSAVLAVAIAIAVRVAVPEMPRAGPIATRPLGDDLVLAWRVRGPALLALLFGLFNASYFAVSAFLPMLLQQAAHSVGVPAYVLSALAVGSSAVGNLAGLVFLARGVRPAAMLVWSFVGLLACSVPMVLGSATTTWLPLCASVAFGAVAGLIPAALFAEVPARTPRAGMQGLVIGWMMQGGNVGLTVGPPLAGMATAAFGWPAVIAVEAVLVVAAAAAVRMLGRAAVAAAPA